MKFLITIVFITSLIFATNIPNSFRDYKRYTLGNDMDMELFISKNLIKSTKIVKIKGNAYKESKTSLKLTLQGRDVEITFSRGDSDDFNFEFEFDDVDYNKNELLIVYGDKLFLSDRGFIYVEITANEYFTKYKKFKLVGNKVKEIKQAYYKVNMKCKTSALTKFYSQKCKGGDIVATIPKNKMVTIILEDTQNSCPNERNIKEYLVQTSFGLVGWVSSRGGYGQRVGNPLSCLMYNGD